MVIAKPIQFTIVKAVPFKVGMALCATIVENMGESATTANPQIIMNIKNKAGLPDRKISGASKQLNPERLRALNATLLLPVFLEM